MAVNPSSLGTPSDPLANNPAPQDIFGFEANARSLNGATLSAFGTDANPQALLESLNTGSTADLINLTNTNPQYASLLSGNPAGMPVNLTTQANTAAQNLNFANDQNVQAVYGPVNMGDLQLQALQSGDDQIAHTLQEQPTASVTYVNDVLGSSDKNRVTRWQTYLQTVFDPSVTVSGRWDSNSSSAFQQYMMARFAPGLFYGNNQAQVNAFFSGAFNMTATDLAASLGHDNLQQDIFLKWLHTQDPYKAREGITAYQNQYGSSAIPQQYAKLSGNWADSVQDTIAGIPILGRIASPFENIFNLDKLRGPADIFQDNRDVRANALLDGLTQPEKDALAGVVHEASHSTGFFGFMDSWDRLRNRVILGTIYDFQNITQGKGIQNPLDMSTDVGKRAALGDEDLWGHVPWYDDIFNKSDIDKNIMNFTTNIYDDPLTYTGIGELGRAITAPMKLADRTLRVAPAYGAASDKLIGAVRSVWAPPTARDVLDLGSVTPADRAAAIEILNTGNRAGRTVRQTVIGETLRRHFINAVAVSDRNIQAMVEMSKALVSKDLQGARKVGSSDMRKLLNYGQGITNDGAEMATINQLNQANDWQSALKILSDNAGLHLMDGSFSYNYEEAMRMISPMMRARLSGPLLQRILARGSFTFSLPSIDATKPAQGADAIMAIGSALGMDDAKVRKYSNDYFSTQDVLTRNDTMDNFFQEVERHFGTDPKLSQLTFDGQKGWQAMQAWQKENQAISQAVRPGGKQIQAIDQEAARDVIAKQYDIQSMAKEASTRGKAWSPAMLASFDLMNSELKFLTEKRQALLAPHIAANLPGDYQGLADVLGSTQQEQATQEAIAKLSKADRQNYETWDQAIKAMEDDINQMNLERSSPMFTTNLMKHILLPVTPAELMVFSNPVLRKLEWLQKAVHADRVRGMWTNFVLARPATSLRIAIGDDASRFFFHMLMIGNPVAAFRYLATLLGAPIAKAARGLQGTALGSKIPGLGSLVEKQAFKKKNIPEDFGTSMLTWMNQVRPNTNAVYHLDSPFYQQAMPFWLENVAVPDLFTQRFVDTYAAHINMHEASQEIEKNWVRDRPKADAMIGKLQDALGDTEGAHAQKALDELGAAHARALGSETQKADGLAADFAKPNIRPVLREIRRNGDLDARKLVQDIEQKKTWDSFNAARDYLVEHNYQDSLRLLDQMADQFEPARVVSRLNLQGVRDALNQFNEERVAREFTRMITTKPADLRELDDLVKHLDQQPTKGTAFGIHSGDYSSMDLNMALKQAREAKDPELLQLIEQFDQERNLNSAMELRSYLEDKVYKSSGTGWDARHPYKYVLQELNSEFQFSSKEGLKPGLSAGNVDESPIVGMGDPGSLQDAVDSYNASPGGGSPLTVGSTPPPMSPEDQALLDSWDQVQPKPPFIPVDIAPEHSLRGPGTAPKAAQAEPQPTVSLDGYDIPANLTHVWEKWSMERDPLGSMKDFLKFMDPENKRTAEGPLQWTDRLRKISEVSDAARLNSDFHPAAAMSRDARIAAARQHLDVATMISQESKKAQTVEDMNSLNAAVRQLNPNLGEWKGSFEEQRKAADAMATEQYQYAARLSGKNGPRNYDVMQADAWARRQGSILRLHYEHPKMLRWLHDGIQAGDDPEKLKQWRQGVKKDLGNITRNNVYDENKSLLPIISQPVGVTGEHPIRSGSGRFFAWYHENVTQPMIAYARYTGYEHLAEIYKKRWEQWYGKAVGDQAKQVRDSAAQNYAMAWVEKNTYQGQRTAMGSALRNVFPFWGATANMNKFWMRSLAQHRHWQAPFLHSLSAVDQIQSNGGVHWSFGFMNQALANITGAQGDAVGLDPLAPFFFTSDGITGWVPGLGPVPSFGLSFAASHDPHVVQAAMDALGPLGEQYSKHITDRVDNPVLGWAGSLAEGGYEALTGKTLNIPFVTPDKTAQAKTIDTRARDLASQRADAGLGDVQSTDQAGTEAGQSVGRENVLKGLLQFLLPVQPTTGTQKEQDVNSLLKQWDTTTEPQSRDAILANAFGEDPANLSTIFGNDQAMVNLVKQNPQNPANLLLFFDRRTSEDAKRTIALVAPWVVDYGTSRYQRQDGQPQLFNSAAEFNNSLNGGGETLEDPSSYVANMQKAQHINTAYVMYGQLKDDEYNYLLRNGISSTSPQAKLWRQQYFDPQFQFIAGMFPDWAKQFSSESRPDVPGLSVSTRPLRAMMNFEVIPQFEINHLISYTEDGKPHVVSADDSAAAQAQVDAVRQKTNYWRQALVDRDNAATAIHELYNAGLTSKQIQEQSMQIMTGLQNRLIGYANENPAFGQELDQFHFGRIEDLIKLENDMMPVGS